MVGPERKLHGREKEEDDDGQGCGWLVRRRASLTLLSVARTRNPRSHWGRGGSARGGEIQAATGGSVFFPREAKRKWAVRMQGWSPTRDGRGAAAVCWLAVNPQTMQAAAKDVLLGFQLQPESRRRLL